MTEQGLISRLTNRSFQYNPSLSVTEEELSLSVKRVEDLYNTSRVSQEKRLNKISKQLEVIEVTLRKISSSKKKAPTSSALDTVGDLNLLLELMISLFFREFPFCRTNLRRSP